MCFISVYLFKDSPKIMTLFVFDFILLKLRVLSQYFIYDFILVVTVFLFSHVALMSRGGFVL